MKNIQIKLIALLFSLFAFAHSGSSQDSLAFELSYEVHRVYPDDSVTEEELKEASIISDLNRWYRPSWIKEYISVEVLTSHEGRLIKAKSKNDTLSQEQKDNMNMADLGSDISVKVRYIPENTLTYNDPKNFNFTFRVHSESDAKFPGGQQQLKQYLKNNIIDKIPNSTFNRYQLATVKFSIDEEGHVIDPKVFWPSEDDKTDKLLLETICNMPNWEPAEYANGFKAKQEFVLTVGDMESCVVNTLRIRRD